jgi:hypothetical protein
VARRIYRQQKDTSAEIKPDSADNELQTVRKSSFYPLPKLTKLEKAEFDHALTKLPRAGLIRPLVGSYIWKPGRCVQNYTRSEK